MAQISKSNVSFAESGIRRKMHISNKTSRNIMLKVCRYYKIIDYLRYVIACSPFTYSHYLLPIPNTHYLLPSNPYDRGSAEKGLQRKDVQSDK